jgi:hypothetical protein
LPRRLVFLTKAISPGTSGGGLECLHARSGGRKEIPSAQANPLRKANLAE